MNTLKEKLTELIEQAERTNPDCGICPYMLAEELAQNGVTIATDTNVGDKWVSVDEPPTKEGWYHVAILDMKTGKYRVENDLYAIEIAKAHNHEPGFCKAKSWPERDKLTHWCPYPEPPKGAKE